MQMIINIIYNFFTAKQRIIMNKLTTILASSILYASTNTAIMAANDEVVVYSSRKEHLIKPLFDKFTSETGIKVKYLTGKGGALIERLKVEGKNTKADMFMTVDAGNLWYAGTQNILKPFVSDTIKNRIPQHLIDKNNLWTGLSVRARTIVYHTDRVKKSDLSTYADLANKQWQDRLCLRTSKKVYTKSLVASILHHKGKEETTNIIKGWVNNLASTPNAKDSHIMKAILAGQCDVGLVNTYYFERLQDKTPNAPIDLFWANQHTTGVHVNISGAGITKFAKNTAGATTLLEWLASSDAQKMYAKLNKEYPANQNIAGDKVVLSRGNFVQDTMNLSIAGELQKDAVSLMQKNGYR
jgi:iron(III) transport system substrate-binding protein